MATAQRAMIGNSTWSHEGGCTEGRLSGCARAMAVPKQTQGGRHERRALAAARKERNMSTIIALQTSRCSAQRSIKRRCAVESRNDVADIDDVRPPKIGARWRAIDRYAPVARPDWLRPLPLFSLASAALWCRLLNTSPPPTSPTTLVPAPFPFLLCQSLVFRGVGVNLHPFS